MLRIKRAPGQNGDLVQFLESATIPAKSGIDANQRYYGDMARSTGILKPEVTVITDSPAIATQNKNAIQAALDAAHTRPEIDTIKVPNAKFLCEQLNLKADHSGLRIEGGGKTLIYNKYHQAGVAVFHGNPSCIGYITKMDTYQPGNPGVFQVRITTYDPTDLAQYQAGDLIYLFPQYFQQPIGSSRDCQLNKIVSINSSGTDYKVITLESALPIDMQATLATATTNPSNAVSGVNLGTNYGAAYDMAFAPRVQFTPVSGGSGAIAQVVVANGSLAAIQMTNYGSGYGSEPTVTITPQPGDPGTGAAATANLEGTQITSVTLTAAGSGYRVPPVIGFGGSPTVIATATARIVGLITSVVVTNGGSNYLSPPTVTIDPPPLFAKWVKNGRRVASIGSDHVVMTTKEDASFFAQDSTVWLCTGSAYDDSDGPYYRVRKTIVTLTEGKVYFYQAIRPEDFIPNRTCLLKGPFIENLTIRNLNCGGLKAEYKAGWVMNFQSTVNLLVENVQMLAGDSDRFPGSFGTFHSQNIHYRNCLGRIENQTTHNLLVENSLLNAYVTHSHCTDAVFSFCRVSAFENTTVGMGSDTRRFVFRDCEFNLPMTRILAEGCEDLVFENCRIVTTGNYWNLVGKRLRFSNFKIDAGQYGALYFVATCTDCVLENVTMPETGYVFCQAPSTGFYSHVIPEPNPPGADWRSLALVRFSEISDPANPPADTGVVFVRDSAGKSQLCARFNTGAVRVIAEE